LNIFGTAIVETPTGCNADSMIFYVLILFFAIFVRLAAVSHLGIVDTGGGIL
jgi:hypothetical protein